MSSDKFEYRITCLGAGYVGGPTMAIIALHCPHIKVIVADINKKQIEKWNSGQEQSRQHRGPGDPSPPPPLTRALCCAAC